MKVEMWIFSLSFRLDESKALFDLAWKFYSKSYFCGSHKTKGLS